VKELESLAERIVLCRRCPRLIQYITKVSEEKTRRFREWDYWGRPLSGFGDPDASILIIGLAPAAHGGNRTGRMFTGDSSGEWLMKALFQTGFANKSSSIDRWDGLVLDSAYVTAVVRCAPPKNKPAPKEIANCSNYLVEELRILRNVKVVVTLGRIAFENYLKYAWTDTPRPTFAHGKIYSRKDKPSLIASYHPSRQNIQTARLKWDMWKSVFEEARRLL
jgi:uracil-DNA glycosylase family 4